MSLIGGPLGGITVEVEVGTKGVTFNRPVVGSMGEPPYQRWEDWVEEGGSCTYVRPRAGSSPYMLYMSPELEGCSDEDLNRLLRNRLARMIPDKKVGLSPVMLDTILRLAQARVSGNDVISDLPRPTRAALERRGLLVTRLTKKGRRVVGELTREGWRVVVDHRMLEGKDAEAAARILAANEGTPRYNRPMGEIDLVAEALARYQQLASEHVRADDHELSEAAVAAWRRLTDRMLTECESCGQLLTEYVIMADASVLCERCAQMQD